MSIASHNSSSRTIEGRLMMADFDAAAGRCRIHPQLGNPVICIFDSSQRNNVLKNMLHIVRVSGEPTTAISEDAIPSLMIRNIERMDDTDSELGAARPSDAWKSDDFWKSLTIEELAAKQNVKPLDARSLFGTWPGEINDGFEDAIRELRQSDLADRDS